MSLAEKAYATIQERIVAGELAPGAVLSEHGLARELGISRTPVGEALRQLSAEGLLEQIPRYGTVVRGVGRKELTELYELRAALESYACGKAAESIGLREILQLQWLVDVMGRIGDEAVARGVVELDDEMLTRFLATDMAFHILILEVGGNARMVEIVKSTRKIARIFHTRRQTYSPSVVEEARAHHTRILDALRARDGRGASEMMLEHIEMSRCGALEAFGREATPGESRSVAFEGLPDALREELERIGLPGAQ